MNNKVRQYELKINKLLTKFLEPGYKFCNDVYLNILLSHLSGKHDEVLGAELRNLPSFSLWLEQAVVQWENTLTTPTPSISTFTLNLVSLISNRESTFIKLNNANLYIRLCKILRLRTNETSASVKLGYLKMLASFLNHKFGLEWLISTDCWHDVLNYCLENQTVYITRDGYSFIYELLNKSIDINQDFCELVIKKIMSTLETEKKNELVKSEIDDYEIQKKFTPTIKLLTYLLEQSYESSGNKAVSNIFLQSYNIENILWNLLIIARDKEFIFDISKLIYLIIFMSIPVKNYTNREAAFPELKNFGRKFTNLYKTLIDKQCPIEILKLCCIGLSYWKKIDEFLPPSEKKEPILFENQIIIFQILPIIVVAFAPGEKEKLIKDELSELFINKLFKISCEHTIRLAYTYRALLMSLTTPQTYDIAQKSVSFLMRVKQHLQRDRAVIAFQAIAYALRQLSRSTIHDNNVELKPYETSLLSALIDGVGQLIRDYHITWTDSVESICITSLVVDFLHCPDLPPRLCIQTLQLAHLTIERFMPPDLALLVGNVDHVDSSVKRLTDILQLRLSDQNWEVRDCALEMLRTVADISVERFPPFQQLVLDARLPEIVVKIVNNDDEPYVRASAVRVIAGMVRVPAFANMHLCIGDSSNSTTISNAVLHLSNLKSYKSLVDMAFSIVLARNFETEPEAVVRREIAFLACELYAQTQIENQTLDVAMVKAATNDLHWEVRVASLDYWQLAIERELADQGMLDGAFPPVTFSKGRKIVALTKEEIRTRLDSALAKLSDRGCLGVIVNAANDTCDLQVARRGVELAKQLLQNLDRYGALYEEMETTQKTVSSHKPCQSSDKIEEVDFHDSTDPSDAIIESILNSSDAGLIINSALQRTDPDGEQEKDHIISKSIEVVKPSKFKYFLTQDLEANIKQHGEWLDSITEDLGSLLDDILQTYDEENDVNAMDCY